MSTFFENLTTASKKGGGETVAMATMPPLPTKQEPARSRTSSHSRKEHEEDHRIEMDTEEEEDKPMMPRLKTESHEAEEAHSENGEEDGEEGELTVDIYDKGDTIVIQSTVAGVRPEDLDVSITTDMITIKGKRVSPESVNGEHYYYKELFWGTFSRTVILPEEIDTDHTEAMLKYGMLTIHLPKKKRGIAQKLKVKAA